MKERTSDPSRPVAPLGPDHPVVAWVRREVLPLIVERLRPTRVIVFDPPDRPASVGDHPPGLLVVAEGFRGIPVADRVRLVRELLSAASPVRPFCLTPEEFRLTRHAPGPLLAAVRTGVTVL
ncbi:MAG: hypothetical protein Kow0062_11860 [Acidobacteriota bacterium]